MLNEWLALIDADTLLLKLVLADWLALTDAEVDSLELTDALAD